MTFSSNIVVTTQKLLWRGPQVCPQCKLLHVTLLTYSLGGKTLLPVAAPGLRIWGAFEGQTHILGGKIEFLKRYCYLPMPLSQDVCPPPRRFVPPPLSKGGDSPRNTAPGDEYPRNIAPPPPEGRMPQEYAPPHL